MAVIMYSPANDAMYEPARRVRPLRVVMVSKALVVGAYQRKAEELARQGVSLTVMTPPLWRDRRGSQPLEPTHLEGYELRSVPVRLVGNYHLHYYPTLSAELATLQPDILHMDEEPYNMATWLGVRSASRLGIRPLFFTWQNLLRQYPPPFRQMEQATYRRTQIAIAGNHDASEVLRAKGFASEVAVIPQFGVDPEIFRAGLRGAQDEDSPLRVGYAGGLVPEKGVDLLLRACARLLGEWSLEIVGEGEARASLEQLASELGVAQRVTFAGRQSSAAMPEVYRRMDVLVLASQTTASWKEQFGRVLIEAMASEVAVVGSDCGEIPHVVGDAGLVFREGDVEGLRVHLQSLLAAPGERARLGALGRKRVLERYTMEGIARSTVEIYERLMQLPVVGR
jgi:glycosyltransferase involved in cell wall biosynthesis